MPEEEARWIFQQLLVAVDYCQRLGIANRDIKVKSLRHTASMTVPVSALISETSNIRPFPVVLGQTWCLRPPAARQHDGAWVLALADHQDVRLWVLEGRDSAVRVRHQLWHA